MVGAHMPAKLLKLMPFLMRGARPHLSLQDENSVGAQ